MKTGFRLSSTKTKTIMKKEELSEADVSDEENNDEEGVLDMWMHVDDDKQTLMNCLSLNIRGIGEGYKVSWVRRLSMKYRISFLGVQEMQLSDENNIDVAGCWYNGEFGFVATPSNGRSGGLLSVWDSKLFQVDGVIKARHFLITIVIIY
uniref:Endonuclease/exonuclease/phosphatase domain-containing protein n=1 Tax=Lactuca sativa TaxID=4236 RepID=A0A9R1XKA4_LACSA|nr:hypothetical protein LSAT_V11C300135590 [Lactuca sativa]